MFGAVLLTVCTLMQLYVFWRATAVPWLSRRIPKWAILLAGALLWLAIVLGRTVGHDAEGPWAAALELLGMTWIGCLLELCTCLLAADLVAGLTFLPPRAKAALRGWALLGGVLLSAVALVQGLRPPSIVDYEVRLKGLPAAQDGTVLVALADFHLGSVLGESWLAARVAQVQALHPDLVVLLGDIVEGHGAAPSRFLPGLRALSAPLGVWAVTGNHESYGSGAKGPPILEDAGFRVLHNRWEEVRPGLTLAGVDDLSRHNHAGTDGEPVTDALAHHPEGAVIFLSHAPVLAETAAAAGAGLMLSGHTHGGQLWPFGYLVRLAFPMIGGRYEVGGMTVIVCRGAGTWGPRMRLWRRGEILRVTLRATGSMTGSPSRY